MKNNFYILASWGGGGGGGQKKPLMHIALWFMSYSISLTFNIKVNFEDFIPKFVSVLTNKRYKTYGNGFSFCDLVHAPGVGLGGAGGQKFIFSEHDHVAYQNEGDDVQNRIQVNILHKHKPY